VILHPAAHTLSPVLHRAAYAELGIDAVYLAFDVPPERLRGAVEGMRGLGIRQLSVSLPHKESVLDLADEISEEARTIGAANTLTLREDRIHADNTDWVGVLRSLEPHGPLEGRRALVLGAGGAARAVVFALRRLGMDVAVSGRTKERAERLARNLGARAGSVEEPWDLLVNATPVGMAPRTDESPLPASALRPRALVFDTVYRPLETRLLRDARERGCRTQDGLGMLVHQAVEQVRLWTGKTPDASRMRRTAERAVREDRPL
jgi:shikimate dehydrogenase